MERRAPLPEGWKFSGLRSALQLFFVPYGAVVVVLLFLTFGRPTGDRQWLGPLAGAVDQPGILIYLLLVAGGLILAVLCYAILAYPERWNRYTRSYPRIPCSGLARLIPQLAQETGVPCSTIERSGDHEPWRFRWGAKDLGILLEGDELLATLTVGPVDSTSEPEASVFIGSLERRLAGLRFDSGRP